MGFGAGLTSPIGRPGPAYRTGAAIPASFAAAGAPAGASAVRADRLRRHFMAGVIVLGILIKITLFERNAICWSSVDCCSL
jgi:hypothetical protein